MGTTKLLKRIINTTTLYIVRTNYNNKKNYTYLPTTLGYHRIPRHLMETLRGYYHTNILFKHGSGVSWHHEGRLNHLHYRQKVVVKHQHVNHGGVNNQQHQKHPPNNNNLITYLKMITPLQQPLQTILIPVI